MKFTPVQHMQMAALMHRKSQQAPTAKNRKGLAELAEGHRKLARKASERMTTKKAEPAE